MKFGFNNYPKCDCGNDLVPIYVSEEFNEKLVPSKLKGENLLWKCPKCGKVIS